MQPNYISQAGTNISRKLRELPVAQSECTIFRVHGHLRNVNDKAYEPEVIAIGPYHRDKDNLRMMEDHKLRYFRLLLQQGEGCFDKYVSAVGHLEQEARKCYANPIYLDVAEFIEMLVLDGCFIIELVRKFSHESWREGNDSIFRTDWIINKLQRDLMLFENQIPFFVLCELFDLIEVPNTRHRLMFLLINFFGNIYLGRVYIDYSIRSFHEIKHLLGLIHICLCSSFDRPVLDEGVEDERGQLRSIGSATLPSEVEVRRLRSIANATSLREVKVKFEKNLGVGLFDIRFNHGTMFLPPLTIEDRTESFLRNLIAYEQYFHDRQTSYVMDFVKFFNCLVDSSKDVETLSRLGIINHWLGDDGAVANMFHKLADSVAGPNNGFIYGKIFDEVNKHCDKRINRWMARHGNRWMAELWGNYLNSPWAIISITAAVVLLLLTATQTVFSVLK